MGKKSEKETEEDMLAENRRKRSQMYTTLAVLAVILLVAAVSGGVIYFAVRANSEKDTIVFAYQDRVADAASIIAIEKGFFEDEGIKVEGKRFSSGPACTQALLTNSVDIATMGDTTAITTVSQQGDNFHILCTHGGGEDRHRIIVSDDSGIDDATDLEGKKIAVKKGTSTHGGLMLFADKNGLDLTDEIVEMSPSEMALALESGAIDAMVASEPTPSQAEEKEIGRELATLGGLNNTYPILIVANVVFVDEHPELVEKFLRALIRATEFINAHPDETVQIQADLTGLEASVITTAIGNHYYDVNMNSQTRSSLSNMADFLYDIEKITKMPNFDYCLDTDCLEKAKK